MSEKLYLFKRTSDGKWVFGQNIDCLHEPGICKPVPSTDRTKLTIIYFQRNNSNQDIFDHPVTDFLKENGTAYSDFTELSGAYSDFFFRVDGSSSAVGVDGFLYLPTSISSKGIRIGERTGFAYAIDRALTATGFSGVENTDWENIGGQASS
ncbi:MAG: hypothetical protein LLF95_11155 [Bacteroidales bacterium]|nr:hypothetical protein [Bacteroidales bacterium]